MTTEKPEDIARIPEVYHPLETEKAERSIDEKVAEIAAPIGAGKPPALTPKHKIGPATSERVSLEGVNEIVAQVAKETKDHKFKGIILKCLRDEGLDQATPPFQEKQVRKVVKAVYEKVLKRVFPPFKLVTGKFDISNVPLNEQQEIFNKCLDALKGAGGESVIIEIAKLCAEKDASATVYYIQNFGIDPEKQQEALIAIAMLCAGKNAELMALFIKDFGIDPEKQQEALIAIAKLCAERNAEATAKFIQNFGIDPEKQQEALIAIAKLCAERNAEATAKFIQNFGIDPERQQEALIDIAKLCAEKAAATAANIKNFGIDPKNQEALIAIAMLCAEKNAEATAANIKNFGIDPKNQEALIAIATLCAKKNAEATAENIKNFGIDPKNQEALIAIAMLCAEKNAEATAANIKNFGIDPKNQKALIGIAVLCAEKDAFATARNIKDFGIDPEKQQEALIAIAKLCAEKNAEATAANIKNFGIDPKNQKALIGIAVLCAEKDAFATARNIKDFGVEPEKRQEVLIYIAMECAKINASATARNIKNFGIDPTNQKALIGIAVLCAEKAAGVTAQYFHNFGIDPKNQDALIAIAKLCAEKDASDTTHYIKNFGITDQIGLVNIAMLWAGKYASATAENIKNFGIDPKNQDALIAIAKLCAEKDASATARNIKNFGINPMKNQDALIAIAKLCAEKFAEATALYIKNFGIDPEKNQGALIDIAVLCAETDAADTVISIKNFGITDQIGLVKIAMECAKKAASVTAEHIQNFGITNQIGLVNIAMECAKEAAPVIAKFIQKFGITDQMGLVNIAKVCAEKDARATAELIQNFGITDQIGLVNIAMLCAKKDARATADLIQNFGITDQTGLANIAMLYAKKDGEATAELIKNFGITDPKSLIDIAGLCAYQNAEATFLNIQNFVTKDFANEDHEALVNAVISSACRRLNKMNALNLPNIQSTVKALGKFRAPLLRPFLLQALLEVIANDDRCSDFNGFVSRNKIPTKEAANQLAHVFMITLFSRTNLDEGLKQLLAKNYLENLKKRSSFLLLSSKNGSLIEFVRTLDKNIPKEMQAEVSNTFLSYNDSIEFSQKIFVFLAALGLDIDVFGKSFEQVKELVKQQIGFPEGFIEIFEKLRKQESLFIYAKQIRQLPEPDKSQVMNTLKMYLEEVTNGRFSTNRYTLSPQLQKMETLYSQTYGSEKWEALLNKWKETPKLSVNAFLTSKGPSPLQTKTAKEFFQQKLADGRFPKDQMPLLTAVSDGKVDEEAKAQITQRSQSKDKADTKKTFDALCAQLALDERLDYERVRVASTFAPDLEIRNDFQGLLVQLKPSSDEFSGYTVENTDNHWDLFLCGTEVAGSCQRVDGDPQLNKNLLGYVVDGKVRMIAVKNDKGQIVARSIIKLLWDDSKKQPVLLIEKVYSNNTKIDQVVVQMAQKEAERLGLDLVSSKNAQDRRFLSYPNRSGFEYEDSEGVVKQVGV